MITLLLLAACGAPDGSTTTPTGATTTPVDCSTRSIEVPTPRGEVAGAWDPVGERLILFGGDHGWPVDCNSQTEFVAETWAFHTDCNTFARVAEGSGPPARGRHAMAYDAGRHQVLVHGGRTREGTSGDYSLYDDLWALDLATDTWTLLSEGEGPSARVSHALGVVGDKLLIYGGNSSKSGASYTPLGDVWAWDLAAGGWTELVTSGGNPGERLFHAAATDGAGDSLYVYGGGDENAFSGPFFGDLWRLEVATATWTELHDGTGTGAPDNRIWANLVHDPATDRLLLWAGHDDQELGNTNQLWAFDLAANTWDRLEKGDTYANAANGFCDFPADFTDPDLEAPERRYAGAAALAEGELIVFGGKTDCGIINDVWAWEVGSAAWTERSPATAGEICLRAFAECESLCF